MSVDFLRQYPVQAAQPQQPRGDESCVAALGTYMIKTVPLARDNQVVLRAVRPDMGSREFEVRVCPKMAVAKSKIQSQVQPQPPAVQKTYYENELWVHKHLPAHSNVLVTVDAFEDENNTFVVREAHDAQTDLFKVVAGHGRMNEALACRLFVQLLCALAHCHKYNVVHRDIKLPSILADIGGEKVYLSGFGYAQVLESSTHMLQDRRGSPAYVSPEMLQTKMYNGQAADIWSLGVVLYVLLCGTYPFIDREPKALFDKIVSSKISLPSDLSVEARDLLMQMLDRNPLTRATIASIQAHPWIRAQRVYTSDMEQTVPNM